MNDVIVLTAVIWFFVLFFFILACIRCRRVRILPSVFIVLSVTFFSFLAPSGEVVLTIGSLRLTLDALLLGLRRSGVLIGMVFLSRIIISPKSKTSFLKRFGKLGNKLTEVFFWLNLLTEEKISFKRGHIIEAIDERLCEIWHREKAGES
jgi:energy-coupling factor transporter transmembrane protein EcfT